MDYARAVQAALACAVPGTRPSLPAPASRAELQILLDQTLLEVRKLGQLISDTLPDEPLDTALEHLTIEQKLEMGETVCAGLATLAFQLAPLQTLDRLEAGLPSDAPTREAASSAIERARGPRAA